jgi:glycosyltransferase involved in cell wall biosynthesis
MSKILLVSDSPFATTGLGRMSKYFLKMFPEHDWLLYAPHHPVYEYSYGKHIPLYDPEAFGAKFQIISPLSVTGSDYNYSALQHYLKEFKPDFMITSMDYDRILKALGDIKKLQFVMDFKWINYFPVDREDYKDSEVHGMKFPDVNVCITKFGQERILRANDKLDIKQIYHPIDEAEFPKVHVRKYRKKAFGIKDDTFLVGTVNRSFARKDTARLVVAMTKFLQETTNTAAYIHGSATMHEGLDLQTLAVEWGVPPNRMQFMPESLVETYAVDQEMINKFYRSFDLFATASMGEGFGFSTVEALLTETPIVAPRNTSFPELVQDFGYLVDTEGFQFQANDHTSMWPHVNVDDLKEKMLYVKNNYAEAKLNASRGREWVLSNLNLEKIKGQWEKILT